MDRLIREGFDIWWDTKINPGEEFMPILDEQLSKAKCIIVIWTKNSVTSEMVKHEARYGMTHRKLLPVMAQEAEIPKEFLTVSYLRLPLNKWNDDIEERYAKLFDALNIALGKTKKRGETQASVTMVKVKKRHKKLTIISSIIVTIFIEALLSTLQASGNLFPYTSSPPAIHELIIHSFLVLGLVFMAFDWLVTRIRETTPTTDVYQLPFSDNHSNKNDHK